jgi:hypothetical protein
MITVAGIIVGIALARISGRGTAWLRAAILAQAADLVTFAAVWEHSQGELNPIGKLVKDLSHLVFGRDSGAAVPIAAVVLILLKLGLIAYLIRAEPYLGRYRRAILGVATVTGLLGAGSNILAYENSALSLVLPAILAVVAARAPERFGDAVGVVGRLTLAGALAIGGLAAVAFVPFVSQPWFCGWIGCPQLLGAAFEVLAIVLFVAALVTLWLTVRFTAGKVRAPG